jgi:hypothetical protein
MSLVGGFSGLAPQPIGPENVVRILSEKIMEGLPRLRAEHGIEHSYKASFPGKPRHDRTPESLLLPSLEFFRLMFSPLLACDSLKLVLTRCRGLKYSVAVLEASTAPARTGFISADLSAFHPGLLSDSR